ncbi:MAG TPA: hypothetical protein VIF38_13420 [Burkholderiales bacterium]|jgi:hypothetical protein
MKTTKAAVVLSVLLVGATAAQPAFAWGRGHFFGAPFVAGALIGGAVVASTYPYYYRPYAPYYYPPYYPAPVVVQQPTVYVEQPQQQYAPQTQGSWYYCPASRAYYPYVKDCASSWQQVAPHPG